MLTVMAGRVPGRRSWRSRAALLVSSVVVMLALGTTGVSAQSTGTAVPRPQAAEPVWGDCPIPDPVMQCALITVPLDYAAPAGPTIEIAVSRIRATDPQQRRGVLLLNPGGPGGSGLDLPALFTQVMPASVLARYDLIGFDPRGIGYSAPVSCALSADQMDGTKVIPWPAPGGFADNVAFARSFAKSCGSGPSADVLPHITTANTARDMDRIRVALGEPKISYLGYSYGTYLGAVYASLFPQRSDRFILDSNVSPKRIWRETFRAWGPAVEIRFPDFTRFAAAHNDEYGLGTTSLAVRKLYFELAARLDKDPLELDGTLVTGNLFRAATRGSLYSDFSFPGLAEIWQLVKEGTSAPPGVRSRAAAALDALFPEVPEDNGFASLFAVLCDDADWPEDPARYRRDMRVDSKLFPVAGGMAANIWVCAAWPFEPRKKPVRMNDHGPANILLVQGTRDPATPIFTGVEMRLAFPLRSRMTTVDVGGHGVAYLSGFKNCGDDNTTAYLLTGKLPADRFCRAGGPVDPPQQPRAGGSERQRAVDEIKRRMRIF